MNLSKLFEMQKALDERIVREKGLEGQDLLPAKILALQVELGELANEWRGFKVWSNDREPRNSDVCPKCQGRGFWFEGPRVLCKRCNQTGKVPSPMLEEYVDCLHFILSIGLELGIDDEPVVFPTPIKDITRQFIILMRATTDIDIDIRDEQGISFSKSRWSHLLWTFICLGKSLGFTWEQIEQAYIAKNAVNHERQATGY